MGGTAIDRRTDVAHDHDGSEAPGQLALVEAFVNTVTYNWDDPAEEQLTEPGDLRGWLSERGLLTPEERMTEEDLARAIEIREALRELLHANHDGIQAPGEAVAVLDRESRKAPLAVAFGGGDHGTLTPVGTGLDRAIAVLLAIVFHAMHDGTWERLKACRNDGCRWAFYDASRNRSGRWCDMAACGNRAKVRAYRERHGS